MASSSAVQDNTPSNSSAPPHNTIKWDPEYIAAMGPTLTAVASIAQNLPVATTPLEFRANSETLFPVMFPVSTNDDLTKDITETTHTIPSFDNHPITISHFRPTAHLTAAAAPDTPRRAVLHIHGGGFLAGSVDAFAPSTKRDALFWDTQIFAVHYRLAPEHPAPTPVEDAYAAMAWISTNAAALGVDPARLVVLGMSAGGGIAAGLALRARDRGLSPPLAKVVLGYPMLDDRTCGRYEAEQPAWPVRPFLTWSEADNRLGWGAYLGVERAGRAEAEVSVYDAPGRAEVKDLVGLPSMYIDVGGLDLFRDEDIAFATRLLEANVETEFHLYPGVPHAFESAMTAEVSKATLENRKRAICSV